MERVIEKTRFVVMVVRPSRASVLLFKQIRLLHGEFVNNTPEIPCYARSLSSRLDSLFTINGGRPVQVERERERLVSSIRLVVLIAIVWEFGFWITWLIDYFRLGMNQEGAATATVARDDAETNSKTRTRLCPRFEIGIM
jgi:hypothetical protein